MGWPALAGSTPGDLASSMNKDQELQVDVELVLRHSIPHLTVQDWKSCSRTSTALLQEVRWLAPVRLLLHGQDGCTLKLLPPERQFHGATSLTYCMEGLLDVAGACRALEAAMEDMPALQVVTLSAWSRLHMCDRDTAACWHYLAQPLGQLFTRVTTLQLDTWVTAALSALPHSASSSGEEASSSGSDADAALEPFSSLERLVVDIGRLEQPFSLQPLGPLRRLQQLHITGASSAQPGVQAALTALRGLRVLCCHFSGEAVDCAAISQWVASLPALRHLGLHQRDTPTPPPAASQDLDLAPLAACTQLQGLTCGLQGRRLQGLSGLSALVALTSLTLGLTGWAKYHHPLDLAPLDQLTALQQLTVRVRLRGKRARDILPPCLRAATRLTQLVWQVAACEEAGPVAPPALPRCLRHLTVQEPPEWTRHLDPWVAVAAGCSGLVELVLQGDLGGEADADADALRQACPQLTRLELGTYGGARDKGQQRPLWQQQCCTWEDAEWRRMAWITHC